MLSAILRCFSYPKAEEDRQFANSLGLPMCQVLHVHNHEGEKNPKVCLHN